MKIVTETITFEYRQCFECPNVLDWFDTGKYGFRCSKCRRIIKDIMGGIPDFCPLPKKDKK